MSAVALWKHLLDVLILETCLIPFAADVCRCNINHIISQFFMPPLCFNDLSCALAQLILLLKGILAPMCRISTGTEGSPRHRIWLTRAILQPT